MSENISTPTPSVEENTWAEKDREFTKLSQSIYPANKTALFDVLAAVGITTVIVAFDGSGDSGQIEDIEAKTGDQPAQLPTGAIEIAHVTWGTSDVTRTKLNIRDAIESLAYEFLAQTHCGWENNEGAYGDFTFDVAERTVTLDYNERVESSEYSQHVF